MAIFSELKIADFPGLCVASLSQLYLFLQDDDLPVEVKASPEYQELIKLKRLRRERMKEDGQARHIGFKVHISKDFFNVLPLRKAFSYS